jgi:hypothetical protein
LQGIFQYLALVPAAGLILVLLIRVPKVDQMRNEESVAA